MGMRDDWLRARIAVISVRGQSVAPDGPFAAFGPGHGCEGWRRDAPHWYQASNGWRLTACRRRPSNCSSPCRLGIVAPHWVKRSSLGSPSGVDDPEITSVVLRVVQGPAAQTVEENGDELASHVSHCDVTGHASATQAVVVIAEGSGRA